jgi:hypothetical protein
MLSKAISQSTRQLTRNAASRHHQVSLKMTQSEQTGSTQQQQ